MIELLDTMPADEISTGKKSNEYLTNEAIEAALQNPGSFVKLAEGKLVDKAYVGALQLQAMKIDHRLKVEFQLVDKGSNQTATGKTSYYYKGRVFLKFPQKEKKAKKTKVLAA